MVKQCIEVLAVAVAILHATAALAWGATPGGSSKPDTDKFPAWRTDAAQALAARGDAASLTAAAALTYLGPPSRSKADTAKAATAALELAVKANALRPNDPAISWLHLQFCNYSPGCNVRDAATTMRWVAADNSAAWLPTLATAQKDKDLTEVDRVLASMAQGTRFDLYANRTTVMIFDALRRARAALPKAYLGSDAARETEASGIANAALMPSFSPLINACNETSAGAERRGSCLKLAKTMQHADVVMAQLVGFAIERRLLPLESKELRTIADRRRVLEWRVTAANQTDSPVLPWLKNARARSRLAKMRALSREEDVCIALLRDHKRPLEPPEDHR